MADPIDIALKVGAPVLGVVGGWVTAAWKATGRVTDLEKGLDALKRGNREELDRLIGAWRLEFQHQKEEVAEKFSDLREQVKDLRDSFDRFTRSSHHDFADNEAFVRYVEEMNRQWKTVERTLGQIEGWMKAQKNAPSSFPSPTGMKR